MGNAAITKVRSNWNAFWAPYLTASVFTIITLPSLATIVFYYGFGPGFQEIGFVFLGFAFLYQHVTTRWWFWLGVFVLQSLDLYGSWVSVANHTWVMWYWGLTLLVATFFIKKSHQTKVISHNARWLLIIIMLVAVFWKVINPYYMDGSFFERNLVSNPLMTTFTHVIGGLPWMAIESNYETQARVFNDPNISTSQYVSNDFVQYISVGITWWVLLIELAIGGLLLLYRHKADTWAHILHIIFIACAYLGAPILGFAWILLVLGIAAAGQSHAFMRPWYGLLFILILLYGLPWDFILFTWLGVLPLY